MNNSDIVTNRVFFAPDGWNFDKPNPFSVDGSYGSNWSALSLDEDLYSRYNVGSRGLGVFSLVVNPEYDGWECRLSDFVQYESYYGRSIIVQTSAKYDLRTVLQDTILHDFRENLIRQSDERWIVHSSTKETWELIKKSGCLKSLRRLHDEGLRTTGIGVDPLGEPDDYIDYIMFDTLFGCSEIVVSSRQKGFICFDGDVEYTPGIRMYFDAHAIINDGLAVRDGAHVLKVYDKLPLEPYLKIAFDENSFSLPNGEKYWTPSLFTGTANDYFLNNIANDK